MKCPVQHKESVERTEYSTQKQTEDNQLPDGAQVATAKVIQGKEQLRNLMKKC